MERTKAVDSGNEPIAAADGGSSTGVRVLLALDRWSQSTESAEFLAPLLTAGSRVRILSVVSYGAQSDGPWTGLGDADGAAAQVAGTQSEVFQSARHILERAGAQVSATHRFGDPADEILNEASDWGADLLLVGHHNGLARWFLGSVTESVVKRSSLPVLVVPKLRFSGSRARDPRRAPAEANLRVRLPA
jgi:nucleotide-binding universal stress UspA family protein